MRDLTQRIISIYPELRKDISAVMHALLTRVGSIFFFGGVGGGGSKYKVCIKSSVHVFFGLSFHQCICLLSVKQPLVCHILCLVIQ